MKKVMLGFTMGILLCSTIVFGANLFQAKDVEYIPKSINWEVDNVDDAINDLYNSISDKEVLYLTVSCWDKLSDSTTVNKSGVYSGRLYFTTSNNGENNPRNIYIKINNEIFYSKSYTSNYDPYLNYVELDNISLNKDDIIELQLDNSDNYFVDILILSEI